MNQHEEAVVRTTREGCLCCPRRALYQEIFNQKRMNLLSCQTCVQYSYDSSERLERCALEL